MTAIRFTNASAAALAAMLGAAAPAMAQEYLPGIVCPGGQAMTGATVQGGIVCAPASLALFQSALPFIVAPSGTMGNNGALTLGTALPTAYPAAYLWLPAGAIASGSAAGWYYATFSSTTAATVYNNTYASGQPTIPASPAAFATTGPGAYAGSTAAQSSIAFPVPGNTLGPRGRLRVSVHLTWATTTNNKTASLLFGGTSFFASLSASTAQFGARYIVEIANVEQTNVQVANFPSGSTNIANNIDNAYPARGAVDTTLTQNLVMQLQLAAATDFIALEGLCVELLRAP